MIHRIIYISSLGEDYGKDDVTDIVNVAQRKNAENGITGLLIFNGLNFLQILEGNRKAVESTYSRIVLDPRHYSVVTLVSETAEPVFDAWSMLLKMRPASATDGFDVGDDLSEVLARDLPDHVRRLLENFDTLKG